MFDVSLATFPRARWKVSTGWLRRSVIVLVVLCLDLAGMGISLAEGSIGSGSSHVPERTQAGDDFLKSLNGLQLQTPITYLPPDSDLDAAAKADETGSDPWSPGNSKSLEWGGIGILIFAGLLVALLLWLGRGQLAELKGPRNRLIGDEASPAFSPMAAELDQDLIARLRRESDPRKGLRQVLERFLKLAAEDNAIVLKRSLTTRELVHRLPGSWSHRGELETLARQTELVLFGGRDMDIVDYHRCLDLAEPFLRRTSA